MAAPGLDAQAILAVLSSKNVKFVVIGGYALELWDVAVPPTVDVDITPEASRANLRRLAGALNDMHARIRGASSDPVPVPGGFTADLLEQMAMLNLVTDHGPLDIALTPAGTDGYRNLRKRSVAIESGDVTVQVAHLEDVAQSKEAAGRPKDLVVLPAIWDHLRRRS